MNISKINFIKNKNYNFKNKKLLLDDINLNNDNIVNINEINYCLDINYNEYSDFITVNGEIFYSLLVKNQWNNKDFIYKNNIFWNDEYTFNRKKNNENILINDCFNVDEYIIEQININLPYDFSNESDIIIKNDFNGILLSEEEFYNQENQESSLDLKKNELNESK